MASQNESQKGKSDNAHSNKEDKDNRAESDNAQAGKLKEQVRRPWQLDREKLRKDRI